MPRLLMFAAAREAAGAREAAIEASSVGEALKAACDRYGPGFERVLALCTVLVDEVKVDRARVWEVPVEDLTEIAILPPVSGGGSGAGKRARRAGPRRSGGFAPGPEPRVRMVDVGGKAETKRQAVAACRLVARPEVRDRLLRGEVGKGDAVAAAQVAGTLAAKRVPDLIPMCHPVRTTSVEVSCSAAGDGEIEVRATVRGTDRTGFEMEALTAAAVTALTLYDFGKAEDPAMRVEGLRLVAKSGGKAGEWRA